LLLDRARFRPKRASWVGVRLTPARDDQRS
jgi:hypothetical protein